MPAPGCAWLPRRGVLAALSACIIKGIERVVPMLRFGVSMTGLGGRWHLIYAKF